MSKIKYLTQRIIHMDYKNMFVIAKKVSKKAHKWRLSIVKDMIECGIKYQAGYYDYQEFEFYLLNSEERKTYLTRGINNEIVRRYNKKEDRALFDDKYVFYQKFASFLGRNYICLEDHNDEELEVFLKDKKEVIVKPVSGEGGIGIEKITITKDMNIETLYHKLMMNGQKLIEEVIEQHPIMNTLYDKSVNTMRVFTFLNGTDVTVLQAVLKFGNGGVVDNFSSGGMYTFLDEDGKVITPAIDKEDLIFTKHPATNLEIVGFQVPLFKEAMELVKEAAKVIPSVQYIGWDVAITSGGPVIVEGNAFPGVFQMKPSLSKNKVGLLPKYRKVMEI